MKKYFYFLLMLSQITFFSTMAHADAPQKEVYYRFEKGLFIANRYHLSVINKSEKMVAFSTNGSANFLTLDDGKVVPLIHPAEAADSGSNGTRWMNPGYEGSISFDIPKEEMRRAKTITFKGKTYVRLAGEAGYWKIDHELIVTYDVRTTEITHKEFAPLQATVDCCEHLR